ncbi:pyridoxal 5'-phosphate synthase lyase subunit PdxS, partial [Francisella tularensis subsp. holarctica]|nr:pyridoxal 5'-phosphate synthase lyase subunit PdxS [Francisella tularensis subsp. holarctica]
IVSAVTYDNDAKILAEVSEDLGDTMTGIICDFEKFSQRGW